jgi:pimeloyl-ACP methyl ester carboxylesterase
MTNLDKNFTSDSVSVNGTKIHYVRAGHGPAIILLHGFPEDWSEFQPIMPRLAEHYTVVAPDLRGIGGSTPAGAGFDSGSMAEDVYQLALTLKLTRAYIVGHDIGGHVAFALVRKYPDVARGAMILDAPIPGLPGWDEAGADPNNWHIRFMQIPGLAEKLVTGRQADFLQYFYSFGKISPKMATAYAAAYAAPEQLHAIFEMYRALAQSAKSNTAQSGPNQVPIYFGTGEKSPFSKLVPAIAQGLRANGFSKVETGVIPNAVHYVVDDNPAAVAELIERPALLPAKGSLRLVETSH